MTEIDVYHSEEKDRIFRAIIRSWNTPLQNAASRLQNSLKN